jgi:urease accessory protein
MAQGAAFNAALLVAWPCPAATRLQEEGGAPYPVAVAAAAAEHAIPLDQALPAYLNAFAASLVSVAVRLVPLGQSAGLRILAGLHPVMARVAERAVDSSLDDLGSATVLSDIACMRHEEQYSRIFRS